MKIRKLLVLLIVLGVMVSITSVNAGLFDFLQPDTEEHDFGNFTVDVPKNSTFNEGFQSNGESSLSALADLFGGSVRVEYNDSKWTDPKYKEYFHPEWDNNLEDEDIIFIEYIDYAEDNLTESNVVEELYPYAELNDSNDTMSTYYWSDFSQYIILKSNDESAVLFRGSNLDNLTSLADSVVFKQ